MQLFITTDFRIHEAQIYIYDQNIYHQLIKVLRTKVGEYIYIQNDYIRYNVQIAQIDKEYEIITNIISLEQSFKNINKKISVAVPFMNKREKYERVVQKLVEIGVDEIVFWRAERSIIHEISENKINRFVKIAKEATEQSRGWSIPEINISKNIYDDVIKYDSLYIADYDGCKINDLVNMKGSILLIVGPEGGLTIGEIKKFEEFKANKIVLGDTILRTETAAILGSWGFKNL